MPSIVVDEEEELRLSSEVVGSQYHRSIGLGLPFGELARCALFNYFAQPQKLIYALIGPHVTLTFNIIHRRDLIAHRITLP